MAGPAIITAQSLVHIVFAVTGNALRIGVGKGLLDMTRIACGISMAAKQGKPRFYFVSEFNKFPAIGRMTTGTVLTQTAFVNIFLKMAIYALGRRASISYFRLVTIFALSFTMLVE